MRDISRSLLKDTRVTHVKGVEYEFDHLPLHLSHLSFHSCFNHPINLNDTTLTHLSFGDSFNSPISQLPSSLLLLSFGSNYRSKYPSFPPSLTELHLGKWCLPLIEVPPRIKSLHFSNGYNYPLPSPPPSLLFISFSNIRFSTTVEYISKLPLQVIVHLSFSSPDPSMGTSLPPLPSHIKKLIITKEFQKRITFSFPPNLTYLSLEAPLTTPTLPSSLKKFKGCFDIKENLPNNITHLSFLFRVLHNSQRPFLPPNLVYVSLLFFSSLLPHSFPPFLILYLLFLLFSNIKLGH